MIGLKIGQFYILISALKSSYIIGLLFGDFIKFLASIFHRYFFPRFRIGIELMIPSSAHGLKGVKYTARK